MNVEKLIKRLKMISCIYVLYICNVFIYIYIYINRFSDKDNQLSWNLKFNVVLSTIFSQTLSCYSAMVSSWRHLISLAPNWKIHPSLVMTQHIRERSRNPPHPKCEMEQDPGITSTYTKSQDFSIFSSLTLMMYHSLGTTFR